MRPCVNQTTDHTSRLPCPERAAGIHQSLGGPECLDELGIRRGMYLMPICVDVIQPYPEMLFVYAKGSLDDLPTVDLGLQRLIAAVLVRLAVHDIRSIGSVFTHSVNGGKCVHLETVFCE